MFVLQKSEKEGASGEKDAAAVRGFLSEVRPKKPKNVVNSGFLYPLPVVQDEV